MKSLKDKLVYPDDHMPVEARRSARIRRRCSPIFVGKISRQVDTPIWLKVELVKSLIRERKGDDDEDDDSEE